MNKPRLLDLFCGAGGCTKGYQLAGFEVTGVDNMKSNPRYVGDHYHKADALDFLEKHGHEYDAIHASPPCQAHTVLSSMPNAKKHISLIAPTRVLLKASRKPWVIENVPGAPMIGPTILCGTMFGLGCRGAELRRHRLFETNWPLVIPFGMYCKHGKRGRTVSVHDSSGRAHDEAEIHRKRKTITVAGGATRPGDWWQQRLNAGVAKGGEKYFPKTITVCGNGPPCNFQEDKIVRSEFTKEDGYKAMGIEWMRGGELSQAIPPAYTKFIGEQLIRYVGLVLI